jgi:hypothetical protein
VNSAQTRKIDKISHGVVDTCVFVGFLVSSESYRVKIRVYESISLLSKPRGTVSFHGHFEAYVRNG